MTRKHSQVPPKQNGQQSQTPTRPQETKARHVLLFVLCKDRASSVDKGRLEVRRGTEANGSGTTPTSLISPCLK